MGWNRCRDSDTNIDSNKKRLWPFLGNQATGSSGGYTNNVWNFETMVKNKTVTINGNTMGTQFAVDRWPEAGTEKVYLDNTGQGGLLQFGNSDYDLTEHSSSTDSTVTFRKSIGDFDRVAFDI